MNNSLWFSFLVRFIRFHLGLKYLSFEEDI